MDALIVLLQTCANPVAQTNSADHKQGTHKAMSLLRLSVSTKVAGSAAAKLLNCGVHVQHTSQTSSLFVVRRNVLTSTKASYHVHAITKNTVSTPTVSSLNHCLTVHWSLGTTNNEGRGCRMTATKREK